MKPYDLCTSRDSDKNNYENAKLSALLVHMVRYKKNVSTFKYHKNMCCFLTGQHMRSPIIQIAQLFYAFLCASCGNVANYLS